MSTIEESIDVRFRFRPRPSSGRSSSSFPSDAEVTFLEPDEQSTRVIVQMAYEPHSLNEPVGNVVGIGERRITDELESFEGFHRAARSLRHARLSTGELGIGSPSPGTAAE